MADPTITRKDALLYGGAAAGGLVAGQHDLGANLERILKQHAPSQALPGGRRTLELNGKHPLVENLRTLAADPKNAELVGRWTEVLYDQALLTEGSPIADPVAFAGRMTELLLEASKRALGPTIIIPGGRPGRG